jgi:TonB family protein
MVALGVTGVGVPSLKHQIAIAAGLAALSLPVASPAAPLSPSGPWIVESTASMCVVQRSFGSGEEAAQIEFRPGRFSQGMRLVLSRQGGEKANLRGSAELFLDGGGSITIPFSQSRAAKGNGRILVIDLDKSELGQVRLTSQLRIKAGTYDATLAPAEIDAAMKSLELCEKDHLVRDGMSPATIDAIETYAESDGDFLSLFGPDDYPIAAIRNFEQGSVGVRYRVTKEGKARDCKVLESSGSARLDARTCAIISRRGKFLPSRSKTGEPIESIMYSQVDWVLPVR